MGVADVVLMPTSCLCRRRHNHDLRHTAATLALTAGIHPKVVSERLGHASIGITLDTSSARVFKRKRPRGEQAGSSATPTRQCRSEAEPGPS